MISRGLMSNASIRSDQSTARFPTAISTSIKASRSAGGGSAKPLEDPGSPGLIDHVPGRIAIQGRNAQSPIAENLAHDPAHTEDDGRSELRIDQQTGYSFGHGPGSHLLAENSVYLRPGIVAASRRHQPLVAAPDLILRGKIEGDDAGLGLVEDLGRHHFESNRPADLPGCCHRLIRGTAEPLGCTGHSVGR
jgi:hypothetical protein